MRSARMTRSRTSLAPAFAVRNTREPPQQACQAPALSCALCTVGRWTVISSSSRGNPVESTLLTREIWCSGAVSAPPGAGAASAGCFGGCAAAADEAALRCAPSTLWRFFFPITAAGGSSPPRSLDSTGPAGPPQRRAAEADTPQHANAWQTRDGRRGVGMGAAK